MDLLVLCPTRGRPQAAREAYESFMATTDPRNSTDILFIVDDDDPELQAYEDAEYQTLSLGAPGNMVAALNSGAGWALQFLAPKIIGFIGDDHRFRTPGWDQVFTEILTSRGGGMVYGNDTYWVAGEIPTQIFMSAEIIDALGWMGLPTCTHLYIDNAWRVIGESLNKLFYVPDVTIEHLHPAAGKAEWDEGHRRVNTPEMYSHDGQAFAAWLASTAPEDVERVRQALAR